MAIERVAGTPTGPTIRVSRREVYFSAVTARKFGLEPGSRMSVCLDTDTGLVYFFDDIHDNWSSKLLNRGTGNAVGLCATRVVAAIWRRADTSGQRTGYDVFIPKDIPPLAKGWSYTFAVDLNKPLRPTQGAPE